MKVQIIQVPYDSGQRNVRMGSGPEHFTNNGLVQALESAGHIVAVETVEAQGAFRAEVATQFALYRSVAEQVAKAKQIGHFPLVLSGNCGATVGAIAGAGTERLGLIWFDAHGEFNTPETTTSGFLDGMGLAIATGLCWERLAGSIPNFRPLPGDRILLIGGRDFDEGERERLGQAGVQVVDAAAMAGTSVQDTLHAAVTSLQRNVEEVHVHIDLDSLNPKEAPANSFVTDAGGLSVAQMQESIRFFKKHLKLTSATMASFDPSYDPQGKTLQTGIELIRQIIGNE